MFGEEVNKESTQPSYLLAKEAEIPGLTCSLPQTQLCGVWKMLYDVQKNLTSCFSGTFHPCDL